MRLRLVRWIVRHTSSMWDNIQTSWTLCDQFIANNRRIVANIIRVVSNWADIKAVDKTGRTAVMDAALGGHTETVKELAALGADVKAATNDGKTAVIIAVPRCFHGQQEQVAWQRCDANRKSLSRKLSVK